MVPTRNGEWIFDLGHVPFYSFDRNVMLRPTDWIVTFHWYVIFAFSFVIVSEVTIIKQVSVGSVQIQSDVFVW